MKKETPSSKIKRLEVSIANAHASIIMLQNHVRQLEEDKSVIIAEVQKLNRKPNLYIQHSNIPLRAIPQQWNTITF